MDTGIFDREDLIRNASAQLDPKWLLQEEFNAFCGLEDELGFLKKQIHSIGRARGENGGMEYDDERYIYYTTT